MKNKLQIFDFTQIFVGLFLGLGSRLIVNMTNGDINIIFNIINILSLLAFIQGIINFLEDKYSIKVIKLRNIDYSK